MLEPKLCYKINKNNLKKIFFLCLEPCESSFYKNYELKINFVLLKC